MDIAMISIALSQSKVKQQASLGVMKKVMNQVEGKGNFIQQMMEQANIQSLQHAAQPHLGGNIDIKG